MPPPALTTVSLQWNTGAADGGELRNRQKYRTARFATVYHCRDTFLKAEPLPWQWWLDFPPQAPNLGIGRRIWQFFGVLLRGVCVSLPVHIKDGEIVR